MTTISDMAGQGGEGPAARRRRVECVRRAAPGGSQQFWLDPRSQYVARLVDAVTSRSVSLTCICANLVLEVMISLNLDSFVESHLKCQISIWHFTVSGYHVLVHIAIDTYQVLAKVLRLYTHLTHASTKF